MNDCQRVKSRLDPSTSCCGTCHSTMAADKAERHTVDTFNGFEVDVCHRVRNLILRHKRHKITLRTFTTAPVIEIGTPTLVRGTSMRVVPGSTLTLSTEDPWEF